jgi:subtilase family serine protease
MPTPVPPSVRRLIAAGAVTAAVVALSVTGASGAQAAGRTAFPQAHPAWASPANAAGAPAADTTIEGEIALAVPDEAGAEALATAVSTPGSPRFHHYVSPAGWISRFAPSRSDLNDVLSFLKGQGFVITGVPTSRLFVVFRGTPAQFTSAFDVTVQRYRVDGTTLTGPAGTPSLPAAVATKVGSLSLDTGRLLTHPNSKQADTAPKAAAKPKVAGPAAATLPTVQCSDYYGQHTQTFPEAYGKTVFPTYICGYVPAQIRAMYGLTDGPRGQGQTVAIVDAYASPTIVRDVNTYSAANGEPGLNGSNYRQLVPSPAQFTDKEACQGPAAWQGEQTLDVESAHGIAPQAHILYSGGFNCGGGIDVALSRILDAHLSTIVSNSYGNLGEDVGDTALAINRHQELQAAAEGIGLYYSSGDDGDDSIDLGTPAVDFPSSSPWVTSVGGTSVGLDNKGKVKLETGWGDTRDPVVVGADGNLAYGQPLPGTFFGGAGGGVSSLFPEPAYQRGVVPAALSGGKRTTPDVAALADPYTGFAIGIRPIVDDDTLATGPFENETFGGTSLASPIVAAEVAVAQQETHTVLGFANPTLYGVARVAPGVFRDAKAAPNTALAAFSAGLQTDVLVTLDTDSSLRTTRGYDEVTGVGSLTFSGWSRITRR